MLFRTVDRLFHFTDNLATYVSFLRKVGSLKSRVYRQCDLSEIRVLRKKIITQGQCGKSNK